LGDALIIELGRQAFYEKRLLLKCESNSLAALDGFAGNKWQYCGCIVAAMFSIAAVGPVKFFPCGRMLHVAQ